MLGITVSIYDFVKLIDPPAQLDLDKLDPQDYYITSGDAVQKAKYLCKLLWTYAGSTRKQLNKMTRPSAALKAFEKHCWEQAGGARKMMNALEAVRGEDVFLETEWDEHRLLCVPKNPRIARQIQQEREAAECSKSEALTTSPSKPAAK